VARSAHALGIVRWRSRCSAADKLARARELQSQGRIVAMVGDGINDAPVLAGVDVSIALGGGASLARRSADVVLLGDSIEQLPLAFALARRMRRVVRQNFGWAIGYNLVALPIAATGWIGPGTAAAGMALSSLLVAANALRLMRVRR
jgi:Cu2+-exporting ATPase